MALNPNFKITETPTALTAISGVASGKGRFQNLSGFDIFVGNQDKSGYRLIKPEQHFIVTDVAGIFVWTQYGVGAGNGSTAV